LAGNNMKTQSKVLNPEIAISSLRAFGEGKPYAILLKGGHITGGPIKDSESTDLLWDRGHLTRLKGTRLSGSAHGTGCALASSIAAYLALGHSLPMACRKAKTFVRRALTHAMPIGSGRKTLNLWV
jgi:hydroxymethylpyrimidine/phosphomethylpyrimidine kinase